MKTLLDEARVLSIEALIEEWCIELGIDREEVWWAVVPKDRLFEIAGPCEGAFWGGDKKGAVMFCQEVVEAKRLEEMDELVGHELIHVAIPVGVREREGSHGKTFQEMCRKHGIGVGV